MNISIYSIASACLKVYQKIPIIIRALIIGLLILCIATFTLLFLVNQNMNILPNIPWVVVPGFLILWLYWIYLSGRGWPKQSSDNRKQYLRANAIPSSLRIFALSSGFFLGLFIACLSILGYLLLEIPEERIGPFLPLLDVPLHTAIPLMIFFTLTVLIGCITFYSFLKLGQNRKCQ